MARNVDMFLKIDGIKGESTDSKHTSEIEIESFHWGVNNIGSAGIGGGMGSGKATFTDFNVTKRADSSSPVLMEKCAGGDHIANAVLTMRKAGGTQQEYMKVKFTNLLISSFSHTGHGEDAVPLEALSINFSKVQIQYSVQNTDGSLGAQSSGGWDLGQQQKTG